MSKCLLSVRFENALCSSPEISSRATSVTWYCRSDPAPVLALLGYGRRALLVNTSTGSLLFDKSNIRNCVSSKLGSVDGTAGVLVFDEEVPAGADSLPS